MYWYNGYSTTVLSNLGKLRPRDEFASCIVGYRCVLPLTERGPVKTAVYSYRNTLEMTVASSLADDGFAETLVKVLRLAGLPVRREIERKVEYRLLEAVSFG